MKKDRKNRAQSEIITTVLIILLVLAAVVIVWNVVKKTVTEGTKEIGTSALTTNLEIKEAKLWMNGGAEVKVYRRAGQGEINSLKFVFDKNDGSSEIITLEDAGKIPDELETKVINFSISEYPGLYNIKTVSVAPVIKDKTGILASEPENQINKDDEGNRVYDIPENPADIGLVGWWKFDGDFSDSAGSNHGTKKGDAYISDNELVLDGNGDYVEVQNHPDLNSPVFSVSIWAKSNTALWDDYGCLVSKRNMFIIYCRNNSLAVSYYISNATAWAYTSVTPADIINWHMYTFSYNGTHITGYLDGDYKIKMAYAPVNTADTGVMTIGRDDGIERYLNGKADNVVFFKKVLSAEEVKAMYNNQKK